MQLTLPFFITSCMLGVGLAMDAFSVSLANGLNAPKMSKSKMCQIAGIFAFFQALMPIAGWFCVHTIVQKFKVFEKFIPWIALGLLGYIGINLLLEGIKGDVDINETSKLTLSILILQGIATSIDALSVGFTISEYGLTMALICALLIAIVTFIICIGGVLLGKKFGTKLSGKASIFGGVILIIIGLEIFIKGVF